MKPPREQFISAQQRMLDRHGVVAQSRFVYAPSLPGHVHVLVSGEGPGVVMINGIGTPGAMWAPLMSRLEGFRLHVVDLPGYGLTDPAPGLARDLRRNAVTFLEDVLNGLELDRPPFVANSLGSLWTHWLALDRPGRVAGMIHVGCPATALGTSAPLPMRLMSLRPLGRLLTRLQPPSPRQVTQLARMVKEHPLEPELVDLLVATGRLPGFRPTFLATLNALIRLRGSRPSVRLTSEQLARTRQPTLLIWGRRDPFGSPEVGRRLADSLPHAELEMVDAGHAPWLTQADRIAPRAREFLQRVA